MNNVGEVDATLSAPLRSRGISNGGAMRKEIANANAGVAKKVVVLTQVQRMIKREKNLVMPRGKAIRNKAMVSEFIPFAEVIPRMNLSVDSFFKCVAWIMC